MIFNFLYINTKILAFVKNFTLLQKKCYYWVELYLKITVGVFLSKNIKTVISQKLGILLLKYICLKMLQITSSITS